MPDIIFSSIIRDLKAASKTKDHPFRYFTLATSDINGTPKMRTVVLRETNDQLQLIFYTDKRSEKMNHIKEHDAVSLLFFDTERLLQISIQANAKIITDDSKLQSIWNQIPQNSRKEYTSKLSPGKAIKNPEAVDYLEGKHFFSVIKIIPNRIEYLRLKRPNHIRVLFKKENTNWKGMFLVP
ncbi:pyridoxamine 5'-phosphate oxidase family protein [Aquimarina algiphila]|uniref:pyridoxamine 5'-phosphate oxidase family protein n=1 Tax=Aquimarina algiphila TaxID=2047982 RepID=UPI00232CDCAE|nr:pyridoxamine 5'-phosphate oxidase family protein [Aquimarina algiphila]